MQRASQKPEVGQIFGILIKKPIKGKLKNDNLI